MSQYCSRMYVKVKNISDWDKLKEINMENNICFDFAIFFNCSNSYVYINGDWSASEDELCCICEEIKEVLGEDVFIIADTTNINVDPYNFVVYSHDEDVMSRYIDGCGYFNSDIRKPEQWFEKNKIKVSEETKKHASEFGFTL